jgi:hypothetical protein
MLVNAWDLMRFRFKIPLFLFKKGGEATRLWDLKLDGDIDM